MTKKYYTMMITTSHSAPAMIAYDPKADSYSDDLEERRNSFSSAITGALLEFTDDVMNKIKSGEIRGWDIDPKYKLGLEVTKECYEKYLKEKTENSL